MKGFRTLLLSFCMFLSCDNIQTNKRHNICGDNCKIWLLYDDRFTPIALCFNADEYQDYSIKSSGKLHKRGPFVYSESFLRGGRWEFDRDNLILNGHVVSIQTPSSDTIILGAKKYLINVTDKFKINNCNCQALDATFKGGKIDSMKTLIMYK